ncbi:nuclear transport factor 2 family protein [Nocardia sp. NPDC055165]
MSTHPDGKLIAVLCSNAKADHVSFISDDSEIEYVVSAELRLADRKIRNSRKESSALLDSEFREFGASGRVWDRESILDMMSNDTSLMPTVDNVRAARLGPTVIQVTYRTRNSERTAVRSLIWLLRDGSWNLYFHQGTLQHGTATQYESWPTTCTPGANPCHLDRSNPLCR